MLLTYYLLDPQFALWAHWAFVSSHVNQSCNRITIFLVSNGSPTEGYFLTVLTTLFAMVSIFLIIYEGLKKIRQVKQKGKIPVKQDIDKNMPTLIFKKAETAYTSSFQLNSSDDDPLTFDTDSYACFLDNSVNTHIWNNANDFIPGTLRDYTNT